MQKNPCRVDDPLQNPIDRESYEDAVSLEDGIYPITTDDSTIISSDMVKHGNGTVEDALDKIYKETTFSGTTDSYGLLALTTLPKIIIGASSDQGGMLFPFINPYGTCYIRAVGYDGSLLSNYALTGKYYYIEAK